MLLITKIGTNSLLKNNSQCELTKTGDKLNYFYLLTLWHKLLIKRRLDKKNILKTWSYLIN